MTQPTFWEQVRDLRQRGLIDRVWKTGDLAEQLRGSFKINYITVAPGNCYIDQRKRRIGDYVKRGQDPKVWRVGRGDFELIGDPEDSQDIQASDIEKANILADELRPPTHKRIIDRANAFYQSGRPEPLTSSNDSVDDDTLMADKYNPIVVPLDHSDRQRLTDLRTTEGKAMFIVEKYLDDKYRGKARVIEDKDGADLRFSIDGKTERIEVKGTASTTIAWQKLKVSSQKSYDSLKGGDALMYRVVDVDGPRPRIYILAHGKDFTMEPEARWAVRRIAPKDNRYPLRGEPYRYNRPFDPVADEEWEVVRE